MKCKSFWDGLPSTLQTGVFVLAASCPRHGSSPPSLAVADSNVKICRHSAVFQPPQELSRAQLQDPRFISIPQVCVLGWWRRGPQSLCVSLTTWLRVRRYQTMGASQYRGQECVLVCCCAVECCFSFMTGAGFQCARHFVLGFMMCSQ